MTEKDEHPHLPRLLIERAVGLFKGHTKVMKTSELTGPVLDWAVAKCEGYYDLRIDMHRFDGITWIVTPPRVEYGPVELSDLAFSCDWAQGGPIIERERFCLLAFSLGSTGWSASRGTTTSHRYGPTPLIAAMRCYVASKLGNEVEIPEELL